MNGIVLDVNNIGHSSSSRLKTCRGGIAVVMRLTNVSAAPRAHGDTTQKRPGLYVCRGVAAWNRDRDQGLEERDFTRPQQVVAVQRSSAVTFFNRTVSLTCPKQASCLAFPPAKQELYDALAIRIEPLRRREWICRNEPRLLALLD